MTTEAMPQALADHRAAFLEALKIRHCSPATIESRDGSLKLFFGYMAGQGMADARDVSRQTVKDYQLWLLAREYAPMTVVSRMQAVRRFFEHLEATGVILVNPCPGIPLPRIGTACPKPC